MKDLLFKWGQKQVELKDLGEQQAQLVDKVSEQIAKNSHQEQFALNHRNKNTPEAITTSQDIDQLYERVLDARSEVEAKFWRKRAWECVEYREEIRFECRRYQREAIERVRTNTSLNAIQKDDKLHGLNDIIKNRCLKFEPQPACHHIPDDWLQENKQTVVANHNGDQVRREFKGSAKYRVHQTPPQVNVTGVSDVGKMLRTKIDDNLYWTRPFRDLLNYIILFILLNMFLVANDYHNNYIRDINFDNTYAGNYFKRIDQRRHRAVI